MLALTRKANLTVMVLILASIGATPLLLPSDAELGSHLLSDNAHLDAQRYLESALRRRTQARAVVMPLAKVYSEQGHHDEALDLLERLGTAGAEVAEMRREMLRKSGRLLSYAEGLEHQHVPEPNAQELRELARVYAAQGLRGPQLAALRRIYRSAPNDLALGRELAYLCRQAGRDREALAIMQHLWQWRPTRLNRSDFLLLAQLAVTLESGERALALIEPHVARMARPADRIHIARAMLGVGQFQQAALLLDREVAQTTASDDAVEVWALAQIALGRAELAYATLKSRANSASAHTVALICRLALRQGDNLGALRIAGRMNFKGLDDSLLLNLAHAAVRQRSKQRLRRILGRISEATLRRDPVGTAHLFWATGQRRVALQWGHRAASQGSLSRDQQLWLADLYQRAGKPREVAKLMRAAGSADGRGANPLAIALMWWRMRAPQAGLRAWPTQAADPRSVAGRALLLAATGDAAAALVRLRRRRGLLRELRDHQQRGRSRRGARRPRFNVLHDWLQALATAAQQTQTRGSRSQRRAARQLLRWAYGAQLQLNPTDRRLRLALAQLQLAAALRGGCRRSMVAHAGPADRCCWPPTALSCPSEPR